MRSDNEKKSIVKTIKISPSQNDVIMRQAQAKGMNFSEYIVNCAVHNSQGITPLITVKMQELVNMVTEIADSIDSRDYVRKEELRQKAYDFEGLFKSVTPQAKLDKLENNIGLFIEGGAEIWEYLK